MSSSTPPPQPNAEPIRFSRRGLLITTAGIAVLLCVFAFGLRYVQENRLQQEIRNRTRMIYLGLLEHEDARKRWPSSARTSDDGRVLYSWRFAILPYLESGKKGDFKHPWTSASNAAARQLKYWCYCWDDRDDSTTTDVYAIAGEDTAFDSNRLRLHREFPDQLVIVMEAENSKTHWMQPGDYDVTKLLAATGRLGDTVKGLLKDRIHILFADGEVWALSPDTPIDALKPFLTITAAKTADRDKQLAPYRVD
jgi:hypothetical protein